MNWRWYKVTIRMRGTSGKRATASRRFDVRASSYEEAITKAQERALAATSFEIKTSDA